MDIDLTHAGVHVNIMHGDYLDHGQPTPLAIEHYTKAISSLSDLRRYAAKKLVGLYNKHWLDDEIGPLDEEGFAARLTDPYIQVYNEIGMILVYFDDGGMFGGHNICIRLENGTPLYAEI
jgi:hypothetical protein